MSITVIGFFKDRANATDAVEQLTRSGFNDGDIDVSHHASDDRSGDEFHTGNHTGSGAPEVYYEGTDNRKEEGNAITRFFSSLFGNDSENAQRYTSMSEKATSIVTVHAAGTEQAEEAANILDASGAMDIDEGDLAEQTHDNIIAGTTEHTHHNVVGTTHNTPNDLVAGTDDHSLHNRPPANRVSTEMAGRSTQSYAGRVDDRPNLETSVYTEPIDSETMSEGLTEADLKEAGIDPADIVTAENAATHFEMENETAPGGSAPGITGSPVPGNLTTAQTRYDSVNADHNDRYSQPQNAGTRVRSRIIRARVEDEYRLRQDHTRVNRRNVDRLPD